MGILDSKHAITHHNYGHVVCITTEILKRVKVIPVFTRSDNIPRCIVTPKIAVRHSLKINAVSMTCPFGLQRHPAAATLLLGCGAESTILQLVKTNSFAIHSIVIISREKKECSPKKKS